MSKHSPIASIADLVSRIPDGAKLAIARENCPVAMEATRALIRQGTKGLHLVCVPTSSLQADLLIGAGCVDTIETAGVTMGEFGGAPRFMKAVRERSVTLKDATCPAIHAALQAGEKGIPFMPLRGIIGSDLLRHRDDWTVIDNPFAEGDPIVALPAIRPDIALLHAPLADRDGNVWVGRDRELFMMAHSARKTLVTAERIQDQSLLASEEWAAATLPALYVDCVSEAPKGAWPLSLNGHYQADTEHLRTYVQMARSDEGFAEYLATYVFDRVAAAE